MKADIHDKEREIADQLGTSGRRLEAAYKHDEGLIVWVIPNKLACAHRPLRYHPLYGGSGRNISPEAAPLIVDWAETMVLLRIKSIICLMHQKEIDYYNGLDFGAPDLIEFYKRHFEVRHIPWEDPKHSKTNKRLIEEKLSQVRPQALIAYDDLPKPVLLHCSAGVQRSSPVAAYIWINRHSST